MLPGRTVSVVKDGRVMNQELSDLAPALLPNFRKRRYLGDDLCLPLSQFTPADQERVRRLYQLLEEAFALLKINADFTPEQLAHVSGFVAAQDVNALIEMVQPFGTESYRARPSELMAKTIHDLRGGGLGLFLMRNALLGLDDEKRAADLEPKLHSIGYIVEKWTDAMLGSAERPLRLEIESRFHGNISECCVEFGALDRILYNLINNACRHAASGMIQLFILPLPETNTRDLRFLLINRISTADEERLTERELSDLFRPGVSSTGSGFGMTVAADFVTNAYGLGSRDRALKERYLGAKLVDGHFAAWFHWPIAPDV